MEVKLFKPGEDSLTEYAAHVHALNHRWWHDAEGVRLVRSHKEMWALQMSELAEALEAYRKDLKDDHLPQYPGIFVELADTVIRILDYAGSMSLVLDYIVSRGWEISSVSEEIWDIMASVAKTPLVPLADLRYHMSSTIACCVDLSVSIAGDDKAFWRIVYDKLVYNESRLDHKHEARALPGGKKF